MHPPSVAVSPSPRSGAKAWGDSTAPSPSASGITNLHDLSSIFTDTFELPRVPLWRILLAVIGYALLITDVARSGASLTDLAYPAIEPNVFASAPPTLLPIRAIARQAGTDSFSVKTSGNPTPRDSVDSHSFKFAATSNGLRTILMQRPEQLSSWSPCLHRDYATPCPRTFTAHVAFQMLNELIDAVRDNANLTTCYKTMVTLSGETLHQLHQQKPAPGEMSRDYLSTLPQRVRFAVRAKSRWIDGASNFLSHYLLDKKYWLSIWATHFDDFDGRSPGMEICADELDRPLLCEKTWADFKRLAPSQGIDKIWDDLSDRAAALQQANPTKTLELTVVETESDPLTLFGGAVVVAHKLFDVVALYRLRDCASPGGACETVEIHDVRYAGRVLYTDAIEWRYITLVMRWAAQAYVLLRLGFLLSGCYHAAPLVKTNAASPRTRLQTTLALFFAVPPQVVAYASVVPVLLYAGAHMIDGVVLYHTLADNVASFTSFFANPFGAMIRLLSIHMRTVWIAACAARVAVFIETSGGWTPLTGVTGLKGYLLPLLSLGAVLFVLRDAASEDARILESNEVEPSATFMFIRAETLDSWKMNAGGVYRDILTFALAACVYILGFLVLHALRRFLGKRKDGALLSWWPQSICWSRCDVPYAAGYLWDPSCLVVVWENDLSDMIMGTDHVRPRLQAPSQLGSVRDTGVVSPATTTAMYILGDLPSRVVLMNLTFLSDPWTYLTVQFGHTRLHLYELRHGSQDSGDTTRKVLHPYSKPRFLREFEMKADDVTLVATVSASDLDWQHLILCR
jgi:hypothetical protein